MRFLLSSILCLILALASCSETDMEISTLEPGVRVEFINQDSLILTEEAIVLLNEEVALVDDSLDYIDSLILAGSTENFDTKIELLDSLRETLIDERRTLNGTISTINSGNIWLERIETLSGVVTFDDSATVYRFPLDMQNDHSEYTFSIFGDSTYSIGFTYSRDTIVNIENIVIQANDFKVSQFSTALDSVTYYPCDTLNCPSNEVLVTVYF